MLKRHCRVQVVKSSAIKSDYSTVFDNSLPISIVRRHSGIISVERRKLITSVSSTWEKKKKKLFQNIQKYFATYCDKIYQSIVCMCARVRETERDRERYNQVVVRARLQVHINIKSRVIHEYIRYFLCLDEEYLKHNKRLYELNIPVLYTTGLKAISERVTSQVQNKSRYSSKNVVKVNIPFPPSF
jgi:hypothetical protein